MAKLSLSFKGHPLAVHHFDDNCGVITIGSDPSCTLIIDSLAVAPLHAKITCNKSTLKIITLTKDMPIRINHHAIKKHLLSHGDIIEIGKHTLTFAEDSQSFGQPPLHQTRSAKPHIVVLTKTPRPLHNQLDLNGISNEDLAAIEQQSQLKTCIQIVNGKHFGKVIPIDGGLTRLGIEGLTSAAIALRREGYFLAHLEGCKRPCVNGCSIKEHGQQLFEGDSIQIGSIRMIFHHKEAVVESEIAADA